MDFVERIKQKAIFLNKLSNDEDALFKYTNTNQENLDEVIQHYKPDQEFKPVRLLRYIIGTVIKQGKEINADLINNIKQSIESRDVSAYLELNGDVLESLKNYKNSSRGMFPNWKNNFNVLFPFICSNEENEEFRQALDELANEIINTNSLKNASKHIVTFEGPQQYGTDHVWMALIPELAPNVQNAYQLFFLIDNSGISGGIYKGHRLTNQVYDNNAIPFDSWESYKEDTRLKVEEWKNLNDEIDFNFINDKKQFQSRLNKLTNDSTSTYFEILDKLIEELDISDSENLVFSTANSQLSFQIGKRYCLNIKKNKIDFISPTELKFDHEIKEVFASPSNAFLYKQVDPQKALANYSAIKVAVEDEILRNNHTELKTYDNVVFRKAVFDKEFRSKFIEGVIVTTKYYLVGAYWDSHTPQDQTERFVTNGIWVNGYDDKFLDQVNSMEIGDKIAIKAPDRKNDRMYIKAKGTVLKNHQDGQNIDVKWENEFETFLVDFSGGYWDTIKEVTNNEHIKAIWLNKTGMKNIKEEFITWLINKPKSNYFNNDKDTLSRYLDAYNTYFDIDIFLVSATNYSSIIDLIDKVAYQNENSEFFKYSDGESNHRPRAILGKTNYFEYLKELFNNGGDNLKSDENEESKTQMPLNQIFYGPPGTGKTYKLKNKYFEMFTERKVSLSKDQYLEKLVDGLTWWQVISIAVLDIETPNVQEIFEHEFVKKKAAVSNSNSVRQTIWGQLQSHTVLECENVNVKRRMEPLLFYKRKNSTWTINRELLHISFPEATTFLNDVTNYSTRSFEEVKNYEFVTFHQSFSYEDFVEGIKPVMSDDSEELEYEICDGIFKRMCIKAKSNPEHNYAIFIDEINRGNVSAIFGELITLLEEDKRLGKLNELTIKLPYSKTNFGVPKNLFLLGTMNTADRSIEALDTALRRRFSFTEVMPDYNVIKDEVVDGVALSNVLKVINERIELLVDRDHTIGHSYFIGVNNTEKLAMAFNDKIVPLLQEYFYGDYGKIGLVLGKGFIEKLNNTKIEFAHFDYEGQSDFKTPTFILKKVNASNVLNAVQLLLSKKVEEENI